MSGPAIPDDVREYLDAVPGDRGDALRAVFDTVQRAVPEGYELMIDFGMPVWVVPLSTYPETYNKHPLGYIALAAQKQYNALYLPNFVAGPEAEREFRERWEATGRTLNMGKSCLRFRKPADVDLDIIRDTAAAHPVDEYIGMHERSRA